MTVCLVLKENSFIHIQRVLHREKKYLILHNRKVKIEENVLKELAAMTSARRI